MSVHYKFKSALEYDTVTFDGLHISIKDLKNAIIQQKRIGKNTDFDLQVTNAQTKEIYEDENALIPKNTSLLIARIPTAVQSKSKQWEGYGGDNTPPSKTDEGGPIAKAVDLSSLDAPEDDKINAMMSQSTQDYDPSNYMKIRGANQMGAVPANYRCYKCHQTGHWIKDCPLGQGSEPVDIKKSTGIPRSFMVPVEGPQVQGAMMTPNGSYAVPVLDHQAYTQKQSSTAPVEEAKTEIPEDLVCSICSDLLTDAVMIPCCGNSFCDECIRSCLLESEDHECPDCHEKDISPGTLIPNRFLRNSVGNFKNTTGYVKKPVYRETKVPPKTDIPSQQPLKEETQSNDNTEKIKSDIEEKTVISEADSTEPKNDRKVDFSKDIDLSEPSKSTETESDTLLEGPPGVSPRQSPKQQRITHRVNPSRERRHNKPRSNDHSPRKHHRSRRSPNYPEQQPEERPGTPTVDEPGMTNYPPPGTRPYNAAPPPGTIPTMIGMAPQIQGPPPNMSSTYPATAPPIGTFPPQGPLPNFRLPPPGTAPPYMPPGPPYSVPPRPMFDTSRPPLTGPPPSFAPNFNTSPRSHSRGYGGRRMRDRSPPPGIIDDPLAAFNRMLREKDERDRRVKQRNMRRSYSRSRSRSRSFSRSPRRMRSRSPRRRSRSRSFSMSRRHQNDRPPRDRDFDMDRDRDRDRDYQRDDRPPFGGKDKGRNRDDRDRDRDRDRLDNRDRYFDNYDDRRGAGPRGGQWGGGQNLPPRGPPDGYYHQDMQQHPYQNNRYPSRDYQPYVNKNEPAGHISNIPPHMPLHLPQPQRRFDDIAPPGVEEPPIPGLENMPPFERFDQEPREQNEKPPRDRDKDREKDSSKRNTDRETRKDERKRRHDKRSKTPEKAKSSSPKRVSKSKEKDSLDKHKKRRRDSSDRDDKKKDYSDDEKKRSKDKKRKKDKKEKDTDKKKKRDRREKHRKDDKEKKKDEFKQVIIQRSPKAKIEPEIREPPKEKVAEYKDPTPEPQTETPQEELKVDLYEDVMTEGIDNDVVENYGKINETTLEEENTEKPISSHMSEMTPKDESPEEGEVSKEYEDSEKDILELHTTDIDLKAELDKNEMLAPVPEKSKWEVEEDGVILTSPNEKYDQKLDKSGKVTNEVLKRAENAIFAKAINAIRPIEIKKISTDRAKLYSGEKVVEKSEQKSQVILPSAVESHKRVEPPVPPVRLSVKERLGVKVDDTDRVIKLGSRTRSRSISPFSKRNDSGRNYTMAERRVEMDYRNRRSRDRRRPSSRDRSGRNYNNRRDHNRDSKRDDHKRTERHRDRSDNSKRDDKKEKETKERGSSRSKSNQEDPKKDKRRRSKSRSDSEDRKDKRKKKDKKVRHTKDRGKKHQEDKDENNDKADQEKLKPAAVKRKPTLDESNFEPDYDLESESEKEDEKSPPKEIKKSEEKKEAASEKAESSSSDSSSSSSDDDRRKKKHKKHRKKKRRETSSSSSESESESSDDEKDKKRKKHKKKQKKKKKSRHK